MASQSSSHGSLPPDSYFLPRFVPQLTHSSHHVYNAELALNRGTNPAIYDISIKWTSTSAEAKEVFDNLFTCKEKTHGLVECDGSCGKKVEEEEVVQFGQCEHNICPSCLATATSTMFDGSPGCCNKNCVREQCQPRRSLSSTSQKSRSHGSMRKKNSGESTVNLIYLKIFYFFVGEGRVSRELMSFEMKSSASISKLRERLSRKIPHLNKSSIYYTAKEKIRRQELIPLPRADHQLENLCDGEERLIVVVTGPGVTIY